MLSGRVIFALAATVIVVGLVGCDPTPVLERGLGRSYFDSTGSYVHAGVSARARVDVPLFEPENLGLDPRSRPVRLYQSRCGSCHDVPDPAMKSGEHWGFLLRRMQAKTRTAGVIPITDAETDSILDLLRRHGRR